MGKKRDAERKARTCPICDSTPKVKKEWFLNQDYWHLKCPKCGVSMERRTLQELITAWNTRYEDQFLRNPYDLGGKNA